MTARHGAAAPPIDGPADTTTEARAASADDGDRRAGGGAEPVDGASSGRAARGTALNLGGSVVGTAIGFVTVGLVTNRWGPTGAGLFFAATALFTLAANGARMGAEAGLTYAVARLRSTGDHASIPRVVAAGLGLTGAVASLAMVAGLVLARPLAGVIAADPAGRDDAETMVRILAVAIPLYAVNRAMFGASRGFATMRPSVIAGNLVRPTTQLGLVALVLAVTDSLPALALAWAGASVATTLTIASWLVPRIARVRARHPAGPDGPSAADRAATGLYLRFARGRAGADLVSAALERIDVILVAAFVGQAGAGLYGAAGRLILAGQLLMIAGAQSTAPLLTASFAAGDDEEAQRLLRTTTAWNVTLLWPLFIGLGFAAPTALSVFGSGFVDGVPLVVVLSLAMLAIVAIGGGDTVLTSIGDAMASLVNHIVALVVMLVAAATLLPTIGVVGAAWAWALSRLTLRILASIRVWRRRRVHALGRPVALAAGAATAAWVPTGLVVTAVLDGGPLAVGAHGLAGGVAYLAVLAPLRRELQLDRFVAVVIRRRG